MSRDIGTCLGPVTRTVAALQRDGRPARAVTLSRIYRTDLTDLWDAVTNPDRLPRWFAPVDGDLRLGGRYQVKDNASGTITACEPPGHLDLTWEFGEDMSWVEVRLEAESPESTRLILTHIAPLDGFWEKYGPGAAGVGWELGLFGLANHLDDRQTAFDETAFLATPEARELILGGSEAWGRADIAAGAEPGHARAAARRTAAFYTGTEAQGD